MLRVEFRKDGEGHFIGYTCWGHSGYAERNHDIVCAAFSTMTNLLIRFVNENGDVELSEKRNSVELNLNQPLDARDREFLDRALGIFYEEMLAIAEEYPQNAKVFLKTGHSGKDTKKNDGN